MCIKTFESICNIELFVHPMFNNNRTIKHFVLIYFSFFIQLLTVAGSNYNIRLITNTTNFFNMSKFCANLAFLFPEKQLLERYNLAKEAGFKAVETGFPFGFTKEQVVEAKNASRLQQVLINVYTGDVSKGELGFAAIPGKENEFKESIQRTVDYAKALGAKKIHIMAGKLDGPATEKNDAVFENNLRFAVKLLEQENILGLIEPINKYSIPKYYMNSYDKALQLIKKINSPNLKLMLDIFHLQLIQGNISNTIRELINYIGHVQIAQAPSRNEPNSEGEINYPFVLKTLKEAGYDDWIGLEYKPVGDTKEGLKWIKNFGFNL